MTQPTGDGDGEGPLPEQMPGEVLAVAPWTVKIASKARRNLKKGLQPAEKAAVAVALERMELDPYTCGAEQLINSDLWRYKCEGDARDVRIVFTIDPESREVRVSQLGHRESIRYPGGRGK